MKNIMAKLEGMIGKTIKCNKFGKVKIDSISSTGMVYFIKNKTIYPVRIENISIDESAFEVDNERKEEIA